MGSWREGWARQPTQKGVRPKKGMEAEEKGGAS